MMRKGTVHPGFWISLKIISYFVTVSFIATLVTMLSTDTGDGVIVAAFAYWLVGFGSFVWLHIFTFIGYLLMVFFNKHKLVNIIAIPFIDLLVVYLVVTFLGEEIGPFMVTLFFQIPLLYSFPIILMITEVIRLYVFQRGNLPKQATNKFLG